MQPPGSYKIAICDDCIADMEYLSRLVTGWARQKAALVQVDTFPSGEAFWFRYEKDRSFDILLLDIEMGGRNGVEVARQIRQDNQRMQIIFITGFPDFLAEGYEVSALHYLMKPVSSDKLYDVLDRAAGNLARRERCLSVTFDRQTDLVPLDRILYVEAQRQFVAIHTKKQVYRMKASLGEVEAALDGRFFRCQRSFLVNLGHVARIKSNCVVLRDGEEIPISRGMAQEIGKAIIQWF